MMAMRQLQQDEELALAQAFLGDRGIDPEATGDDQEAAVVEAIRSRGWEPELTGLAGNWDVAIGERHASTQARYGIASGPDRITALLRALEVALTWLTLEEERRVFDEQARRAVGLSGEEFMRRWRAEELPADDPTVRHLLMLRPLGW